MIIAHIQTHSAVLGNGNGVFYLNAAPAKLVIRCFDVQNHICLQHSLIIRCDRRVIIDLKTQTVTHMVPPVMRDTIAASRLYCNLKQLTGSDAGTGCGDSRLCADTNRIIQTNGFFIRRPNAYRSGQIRCITLIVAPVIKTNQTSTFDRNRLVDGITKCRTFVGSRHAEDILRAVLCRMAAEAVPQVLLCVAGTEILQTGEQCLLSDLRRTCDARYLFLSFNHASLIEYCCAGNRCRGECCKYAGGSFVWHTAGIQSDLHTIIGGGGLARLTGITFFALALGFLLAKDKKNYGKITLKGLQNPMLGTIIMAYIMAGMLAQLLRQSGLIDALIWGITRLGLNAGWIPMIAFLTCVLISTSCGTSTGSVAAVAPVLLPLAHGLGINMGLMCGAIISGAIFGDNLAPISDTTISSALTQEADISQVVRTRFPYAAISGAVAAVLFAVVGLTQDANIPADLELDGSTAKSLFLLVLPVLMVILMRKGWDLMGTLILCNLSGIVLNLVLGTIAPAKMFANDGPIVAGMSGMMTLVLYVTLLFQLLEILNSSGAFDGLTVSLMKHCKSPRSGELICYLAAALGSVVTGGSGIAIVFFGSLVRRITKAFHIDRCRGANILDGVACGATGLMPHGNPTLVSLGVALAIDGVDPNFSFLDIIPYNFHCWGLMLIFLLSILTGIGRRFEKPEETANA